MWKAFDKVEPIGNPHREYLVAQLSSLIFNTTRSKKEDTKGIEDFFPKWTVEDPDEATPQAQQLSTKDRLLSLFGLK